MQRENFYQQLASIAGEAPDKRHRLLCDLHTDIVTRYWNLLQNVTDQGAETQCPDGRTVNQIVGHIAEWDRYTLEAMGEIIAGVQWPGIMSKTRYVESDGHTHAFNTVNHFNAHQMQKYLTIPWTETKAVALAMSKRLHVLFTQSALLPAETLEQTRQMNGYELPTGVTLNLPCGWFLWMVTLEHEGVEHAADLELGCRT